jgi:predicted nucleic acid-binding protein
VTVVDASVVLQWLLGEPAIKSQGVLERHLDRTDVLAAPELLHYEVGNVLVTKTALAASEAAELFGHFLNLEIQAYSLGAEEYRHCLALAQKHRLTVYHASYLVLALSLNAKLVTADRKFASRVSSLGIVQSV